MLLKRISFFVLVVLCCSKASAISYPDSILFKGYADQFTFRENLVPHSVKGYSPQQAKRHLDSLQQWADSKDDVVLKYGLMISSSHISLSQGLPDTTKAEKGLLRLAQKLEENGLPELQAEAQQRLAMYYWERRKFAQAFEHHINAYNIYSKMSVKEFPAKPQFLLDFGGRYYHFADYGNAIAYVLEGYRANPGMKEGYIFTMLNTLGLCYLYADKLDSAEYYFRKIHDLAESKNDAQWPGIISGNLGGLYFKLHRYDEALKWFRKEISSSDGRASMNVANSYAIMTEIFIDRGQKDTALHYANMAYGILKGKENYTKRYDINRMIYLSLAKAHFANGNMAQAYKFLDSSMVAKDSVDKKRNAHVLAGIRHKIGANERLKEQEQFERDAGNYKTIRNILIITIILLVIIGVLLYNRQKLKHSFSQKQLEEEKKYIESELEVATKQLGSLVTSISEKNDLIEKFTSELDRLREHLSDEKLFKADEALMHLQKATIITDDEWDHFLQMFDKVNAGFITRLNKKLKGLSPIESKFIILSKLKLSTKEVASALGISPESVRLNRKRLYSKLGLEEGEHSLQTLLDSI
ncbi:MAG TPA: tetratricopeptide repeat protein [Flavipsychrobacter sp.]|nr:tetratricopeptide repeat protein [Flavipsychrobacter sp.]